VRRADDEPVTIDEMAKAGSLGKVGVWIAILRDSEENLMGLRSMGSAEIIGVALGAPASSRAG